MAGITTFSSGFPLQITGGGFGRPDVIGDPVLPENYRVIGDGVTAYPPPDGTKIVVPRNSLLYFDPNAFRNRVIQIPTGYVADPYFYGTAPTYFSNLRIFGMNDTNLSLAREFVFRERFHAQLRGEAFNAFNHTIFGAPDRSFGGTNLNPAAGPLGSNTSSTFGTVDINSLNLQPRQVSVRLSF